MKFYIASSLSNKEQVRYLASRLEEKGFLHTYDWTKNENVNTLEKLAAIGEAEKAAVMDANFFILVLPGGFGSHTELGMAIGSGKRIYIYSASNEPFNPEKTTTFYHIDGIGKFIGDFDQFVGHIIKMELAYNA